MSNPTKQLPLAQAENTCLPEERDSLLAFLFFFKYNKKRTLLPFHFSAIHKLCATFPTCDKSHALNDFDKYHMPGFLQSQNLNPTLDLCASHPPLPH